MVACATTVHSLSKILSATTHLAYQVHAGQGPYLALIHGFLSSSRQWSHNLEALGRVCKPVTIDLWGHGRSPAPAALDRYQPEAYMAEFEHIRKLLGAQEWFVCGYSIGAGLTIRYTHQYPERVLAHIFTNSSSGFADTAQIAKWRQDAESSANNIIEKGLSAIERIAVHPRFAKRLPADIYQALIEDATHLSPLGVANTLAATTPNASVRDIVANNPKPALLCYGRKEKRFANAKQWACDHMAQLCVADLDAGHAVNMEDSEGFNTVATQFIMQHTPASFKS